MGAALRGGDKKLIAGVCEARRGNAPWPIELNRIAIMDRVGGPLNYFALQSDLSLYEDLVIVMLGEKEAAEIMQAERRAREMLG